MTADRIRGAVLYAGAAALLAAGGFWWVRGTPRQPVNPSIAAWTATAERLLPDPPEPEASDTLEVGAGVDREVSADLDAGSHHVTMVCVGGSGSLVRVSLGTVNDSGRGLDCTVARPLSFDVGLATGLRLNLDVGDAGPVVFRYTVTKASD